MNMLVLLLCVSLPSVSMNSEMKNLGTVKKKIEAIISATSGTYAVAMKDLRTGEYLYINERELFHAASTMKTPVMVEIFNQVEQKKFSLEDSIVVLNTFKSIIDGSPYSMDLSEDSDDHLYDRIGKKETVRSLMEKMITVSSNLATNILIEKVDPQNVMRTIKSYGMHDIQVLRGVEDGKAFRAGKNNVTTAYDLALLFERIATGQSISPEASKEMVNVLKRQKFKIMIPALLPDNVVVAHKTGSITNVQHDSGIVFLPDGRAYVLVVLSKNLKSNAEGIDCIARISRAIYDYYTE
ncbi:MAG: serine hydrolase [Bacteroidota bacterium]